MENNILFRLWVNHSLRNFHVTLSVFAVVSQIISKISNNFVIGALGEAVALFTILHFFLHGYFYRQQRFLSDNMRVYSLPKKKIAKIGSLFLALFLICICIGITIVRELYTGSLLDKLKSLLLFLLQSIFGTILETDGLGKDQLLLENNHDLLGVMNQFSPKTDSPWENLINNIQTILILIGVLLLITLCIWAAIVAIRRAINNVQGATLAQKTASNTNDQEKHITKTSAPKEKLLDFSPAAKMRRIYRRFINQNRHKNQSLPKWMTPSELESFVSIPEEESYQKLHDLYEKARYSPSGCDEADVQIAKKLKI